MKLSILLAILALCALVMLRRFRPAIPGLPRTDQNAALHDAWLLWTCFVVSGILVSALLPLAHGEPMSGTLGFARYLFWPVAGSDSWMPMLRAAEHMSAHPDQPVYQAVFFEQKIRFQYPLTSQLLLDIPHRWFGVDHATAILALQVFCRLCVPAIGLVFFKLFMGALERGEGRAIRLPWLSQLALLLVCMLTVVVFDPITSGEAGGQIQTAITLFAALALLAWQRGRPVAAGVMFALCCAIKPQWAVIVVWALRRRQWRFAAAVVLCLGALVLIALGLYGWANMMDYLPVLSYLGRHGETFFVNQSINGLLNRLFDPADNLVRYDIVPAEADLPGIYAATVVSSVLILGLAMFWKITNAPTTLELALVVLSLTMASPVAWVHHYGVLLPIFAVAFPLAWRYRPFGRATVVCLWIAYIFTSQSFFALANMLAHTRWNFVQSYLFFAALFSLVLLYRLSWVTHAAWRRDSDAPDARSAPQALGAGQV